MRRIALGATIIILIVSEPVSAETWPPFRLVAQSDQPSRSKGGSPSTQWLEIVEPRGAILRIAVAWPEGDGPVPVVIVLHGTEGFNQHDVSAAETFAAAGFLGVAACWFAGADCPHGPAFMGATLDATQHVRTLITAVLRLPRARADRVALFGHSRGGTLALLAASTGSPVHAVVATSAQYSVADTGGKRHAALDVAPLTVAVNLRVPVLILHATGDAVSDVGAAQDYERTLRRLGKPVESHYYESGDGYYTTRAHELAFTPNTADDIIRRSVRFLKATSRTLNLPAPAQCDPALPAVAGARWDPVTARDLAQRRHLLFSMLTVLDYRDPPGWRRSSSAP